MILSLWTLSGIDASLRMLIFPPPTVSTFFLILFFFIICMLHTSIVVLIGHKMSHTQVYYPHATRETSSERRRHGLTIDTWSNVICIDGQNHPFYDYPDCTRSTSIGNAGSTMSSFPVLKVSGDRAKSVISVSGGIVANPSTPQTLVSPGSLLYHLVHGSAVLPTRPHPQIPIPTSPHPVDFNRGPTEPPSRPCSQSITPADLLPVDFEHGPTELPPRSYLHSTMPSSPEVQAVNTFPSSSNKVFTNNITRKRKMDASELMDYVSDSIVYSSL